MKCPVCKSQIQEGSLYCDQCGEDIHMVPDFEPTIEDHLQESNQRIARDIHPAKKPVKYVTLEEWDEEAELRENTTLFKKLIPWIGAFLLAVVLGVCVGLFFHFKNLYSTETIILQAREQMDQGNYKEAIEKYTKIQNRDDMTVDAMLELSEAYRLNGQEIQYENQLWEVLRREDLTDIIRKNVYQRLINIYMTLGDYAAVAEMSKEAGFESIRQEYAYLQVEAPECSLAQGYYENDQLVSLSANQSNLRIYYSLDGSDPSEGGLEYTTAFLLEQGNYLLQAVCVNEYDLVSSIATWEFHIADDTKTLPIPEINLFSGYFTSPQHLEVLDTGDEGTVYYTTDGTDPDENSLAFTHGEWLPLGESDYKFIRIDSEGHKSLVLERVFHVNLETAMTVETGRQLLLIAFYNIGICNDQSGHTDSGAVYNFQLDKAVTLSGVDYFIFAETVNGEPSGFYYAVNMLTENVCPATVEWDEIILK